MGFRLGKKSQGTGQDPVNDEGGKGEVLRQEQSPVRRPTGDTVRMSFRLPQELHTRLRLESVRRGLTIVGLVSGWVEAHTPSG
jgi:hypothetical protein